MLVAVDSSTLTLSLALFDGPTLVKHVTLGPPQRVSKVLPQAIIDLVPLEQISAFVVGLGPGSFTGLRISLACVKGLAYAKKVPVAGVSSLSAVEAEGPAGVQLFASAVVKKGELYLRRDGEESVVTVAGFAAAMRERPLAVALGPGVVETRGQLIELGVEPQRLLETVKFPSAVELAKLAKVPAAYDAKAVFALEPHYIRSSGAEDNPKFPPLVGVPSTSRLKT
ncbi:MAG: tRNA (adenosine(37)-N6)-threonylcarbamoyltransferase complex dimerization subunit type 1 TsaB [Myxococcaceae bacterium]|nr:tRNA (adenosine(37)-N6)-threonylcarbamoyltransferase complex dimerization subunit type 1 TsaB [Myxococcaceae bacterium]